MVEGDVRSVDGIEEVSVDSTIEDVDELVKAPAR